MIASRLFLLAVRAELRGAFGGAAAGAAVVAGAGVVDGNEFARCAGVLVGVESESLRAESETTDAAAEGVEEGGGRAG